MIRSFVYLTIMLLFSSEYDGYDAWYFSPEIIDLQDYYIMVWLHLTGEL